MSANGHAALTFTVELTDAQLVAIAERVAGLLVPSPASALVDAQTVADALSVTRDTVYAHAERLGGVRIGNGERPRWRFVLAEALEAWPRVSRSRGRPGRRRADSGDDLLPVRGEAP